MFIVDTSVTAAWCFPDETNTYVESVLDQLRTTTAQVPSLWPTEMANVLLVGERRGRIPPTETPLLMRFLGSLSIRVHDTTSIRVVGPVLGLARAQRLSVYDATYLQLALREGLPLATQDAQLRSAAPRVGVVLLP